MVGQRRGADRALSACRRSRTSPGSGEAAARAEGKVLYLAEAEAVQGEGEEAAYGWLLG